MRKLGRTSNKRRAMLRSLATDLIIYERVETTETRAKELKKIADKMVTLGKKNDLHARRQASAYLINKVASKSVQEVEVNVREGEKVTKTTKKEKLVEQTAVQKLFNEIAPRYADRNGGYTRVVKCGPRRGDNAQMAIIEFV